MMNLYILDKNHNPVPCSDDNITIWGENLKANRFIKQETTPTGYYVSTIFLGIDHSFNEGGKPILFETMVFPPTEDGKKGAEEEMKRYATWDEAIQGHKDLVLLYSI